MMNKIKRNILLFLAILIVMLVISGTAFWAFNQALRAETNVRYTGIAMIISEKLSKTIRGMEMNARNVFNEVERHLDSPAAVEEALKSKTSLNPDTRGYFAAFRYNYFKEKGMWYEPYVHQLPNGDYKLAQVGSARHDYTKSDWYVQAEKILMNFWSKPYYYYDGTRISGHYCTFVEPILNDKGELACVCGADITLEWISNKLQVIDYEIQRDEQLNMHRLKRVLNFYSVIIDDDGSCIAHPEGKNLAVKDVSVLMNINKKKSGVANMTIDGEASTIYYVPIDGMDWSLAIVTPQKDIEKPFVYMGIALLLLALLGSFIIWILCLRLTRHNERVY